MLNRPDPTTDTTDLDQLLSEITQTVEENAAKKEVEKKSAEPVAKKEEEKQSAEPAVENTQLLTPEDVLKKVKEPVAPEVEQPAATLTSTGNLFSRLLSSFLSKKSGQAVAEEKAEELTVEHGVNFYIRPTSIVQLEKDFYNEVVNAKLIDEKVDQVEKLSEPRRSQILQTINIFRELEDQRILEEKLDIRQKRRVSDDNQILIALHSILSQAEAIGKTYFRDPNHSIVYKNSYKVLEGVKNEKGEYIKGKINKLDESTIRDTKDAYQTHQESYQERMAELKTELAKLDRDKLLNPEAYKTELSARSKELRKKVVSEESAETILAKSYKAIKEVRLSERKRDLSLFNGINKPVLTKSHEGLIQNRKDQEERDIKASAWKKAKRQQERLEALAQEKLEAQEESRRTFKR